MSLKSNWSSKCDLNFLLNLRLHKLIYQETPQKIVPIVIWQQKQLYDISIHVGMTSITMHDNLNLHYSLQLYNNQ